MSRVFLYNRQSYLQIDSSSVSDLVKIFLSIYCVDWDEVIIHFVTPQEIAKIHKDFFSDPTPTDCISFPMGGREFPDDNLLLGEIFISPISTKLYSHHDPYEELSLYIVHSLLHLIGYDDRSPDLERRMRIEEFISISILKEFSLMLRAAN